MIMTRILRSPWIAALVGCALYLGTTAVLLSPGRLGNLPSFGPMDGLRSVSNDPSWRFRNPEFDQLVEELKNEKEALAVKEQQLKELQARLEAERSELTGVTQMVAQLQADFDRNVIRIKDQEADNLKRQAKVLAGMSPEGAAGLLNEMP